MEFLPNVVTADFLYERCLSSLNVLSTGMILSSMKNYLLTLGILLVIWYLFTLGCSK